jgi:molybdate transport system substrate-binding protein
MRFTQSFRLLIPFVLLATRCSSSSPQDTGNALTVYAAVSLTAAFAEIGEGFEATQPGRQVRFNFAGSQQLAQQIAQGAPADVFASADEAQIEVTIESGRVDAGRVQVFANNRLVVIYPRGNPGGITSPGDLARPGLQVVLANPVVPVGNYSQEFLDRTSHQSEYGEDFKARVLQNVVSYEENVKAVVSKVALGEADAGIVYTSDISPANAEELGCLEIPDASNVVASYYIAPLEDSSQSTLATEFIAFVLSGQGQDILAQFSLLPVH